ncbi:CLUMA_CG002271, isoform A [Clunio marinus]|uniref:CLUMA_CG002271, isoform A n=1 Tax=Clunio marinus TaxID=568069 RepID=A0A1J1HLR4_9DIPT|nr:CLUMA_CG002271, isoform A [Clunio marinus]
MQTLKQKIRYDNFKRDCFDRDVFEQISAHAKLVNHSGRALFKTI